jgi:hypothetical protein
MFNKACRPIIALIKYDAMGVLLQNMNETKFELRKCFSLSAYEQIFVAVEI